MAINDHLTPVQGRVVVHCRLMSGVIVVGEKVEEVEGLIEPVDGVTLASVLQGGRHSHRDQQPLLPSLLGL